MPPSTAISYLAIRAYSIFWLFTMAHKYFFGIEIGSDNGMAIAFIIIAFCAIIFSNHYKFFDLHNKILIAIPPLYFILISIDKMTFKMLLKNDFNPFLGIGFLQ